MNAAESEVVVLNSVFDLIGAIVNYEVLALSNDVDNTTVRFNSSTHGRYFNIVLVDLLSATDKAGPVEPMPYLRSLKKIAEMPQFDFDGSIEQLRVATDSLRNWLDESVSIEKVWLPSVSLNTTLRLTRLELVKIAGNICRHNILRAAGIAQEVQQLLEKNGAMLTIDQSLLILSDLHEVLHTDIFHYHSSTIAEFLNEIRWGIYAYLQPEFLRSMHWLSRDPPQYTYRVPDSIQTGFARACYWELMNSVRAPPYMKRFRAWDMLKRRH